MADRIHQLVLEGLSRAVAEPAGRPLHGGKSAGLFAASAAGKRAAQHCKEVGLLHVIGTQTRGKAVQEICAITEKGVAHLLEQVSPKQVLEEFVRAVEARARQVEDLVTSARTCQATFDALKAQVEKVLTQVGQSTPPSVPAGSNGQASWPTGLLGFLSRWSETHAHEDCPLPDAYRQAKTHAPALTIGQFHDGLRQLHDQGVLFLHPWTGPLYEIPEPAYALLVGHAVVYYASRRNP